MYRRASFKLSCAYYDFLERNRIVRRLGTKSAVRDAIRQPVHGKYHLKTGVVTYPIGTTRH